MESNRSDAHSEPETGIFTYAQYIGKGLRDLGEHRLEKRDLAEAWRHAPVETCCIEFFERAESVVGSEVLKGRERNRSIGYDPSATRLIDDEIDAEDSVPLDPWKWADRTSQ